MAGQGGSFWSCHKHKMVRSWKYLSVNALFWEIVGEDDRLWEDNCLEGLEKRRNWGGRC